jgi:hypothetical protein
MANQKVIIAEIKSNDKFVNIKSNEGIWYGIGKEKSPKLYEEAKNKAVGEEITGNSWESKPDEQGVTKHYLFEIKENGAGGNKGTYIPKNPSLENARTAALTVGHLYFGKMPTKDQFDELFEHIFAKIASKV